MRDAAYSRSLLGEGWGEGLHSYPLSLRERDGVRGRDGTSAVVRAVGLSDCANGGNHSAAPPHPNLLPEGEGTRRRRGDGAPEPNALGETGLEASPRARARAAALFAQLRARSYDSPDARR